MTLSTVELAQLIPTAQGGQSDPAEQGIADQRPEGVHRRVEPLHRRRIKRQKVPMMTPRQRHILQKRSIKVFLQRIKYKFYASISILPAITKIRCYNLCKTLQSMILKTDWNIIRRWKADVIA